jgi:hypothetical protein
LNIFYKSNLLNNLVEMSEDQQVDFTNPESIEKHYKPILLLVARIIYTNFLQGPVAPYIKMFILLIIVLPSELLVQLDNKFIIFLYYTLISEIAKEELTNKSKSNRYNDQYVLKKINNFCDGKIKIIYNKLKKMKKDKI